MNDAKSGRLKLRSLAPCGGGLGWGVVLAVMLLAFPSPAPAVQQPAKAPAADKPAAQPQDAAQQPAVNNGAMDVTVTGELQDEIPLTKDAPPNDVSFDKMVGLSREGQTDRVLASPVEHMTGEDQMSLLQVDSRQAYLGLPARIPGAPFIRMEVSPGLSPASWTLEVLDQDDKSIKALEGTALPKYVVEWDGFQEGTFKLHPGSAYTPVLLMTDDRKRVQRYFGEPVHFAAIQYMQDKNLHIEFDNNRLFERGRAGFSSDMMSYLAASLNLLRQEMGKPIRLVMYARPGAPVPAQKRLDNLKAFYKEGLALEDDMISFSVQPMNDRGDVTEILEALP